MDRTLAIRILLTATIVSLVASFAVPLIMNPDLHTWPSITRCRICDKRVFVWQGNERRAFNVQMQNPDRLLVASSASGIVHTKCKGHPDFELSVQSL